MRWITYGSNKEIQIAGVLKLNFKPYACVIRISFYSPSRSFKIVLLLLFFHLYVRSNSYLPIETLRNRAEPGFGLGSYDTTSSILLFYESNVYHMFPSSVLRPKTIQNTAS